MQEEMIMMNSPEAATKEIKEVWISSKKRAFFDERAARFDGCTHSECEKCGSPCEKHWLRCEKCRVDNRREAFLKMPEIEWDSKTPLCIFDTDTYFFDYDELEEYCADNDCKPQNLDLVVCEPVFLRPLSEEYFLEDIGNEDVELPANVRALIDKFNEDLGVINKPIVWEASNKRVKITL